MVNLRTRPALGLAAPLTSSTTLISQSFIGDKTPMQRRKRVKAGQTDSIPTPPLNEAPPVKKSKKEPAQAVTEEQRPFLTREEVIKCTTINYPKLPFHLPDAVQHLRNVDSRFHVLFDSIELTPYKEIVNGQVKELDVFRTLTSSVLGQQVSWLAARAILYRFIRLFFPSLPEKPDFSLIPRDALPFPHPIDVAKDECTEEKLRSAGLSGQKVKYIKDIAKRFSDGRLDVRKIVEMDEEECISELVKIKGVGKWTAEMLLIFALRRADILPVGDLGVQRGMVIFYLSDASGPSIVKRKKIKQEAIKSEVKSESEAIHTANEPVNVVESHQGDSQVEVEETIADAPTSSTGPQVKVEVEEPVLELTKMQPLPESVSLSTLKSRAEGKKAKGNVYLT